MTFDVGFGKRAAVAGRRADQRLRVVGAALRIFDDAVLHAVDAVARGDRRGRRRRQLARGDRIVRRVHHDRSPEMLRMEPVPVDRRRRRHDAVVILRIALRLHQPLASAGGAAVEVGILRRHAVHRLRQRLAGDGHLVNADVRVVADGLPVQPAVGVERKVAAPPSCPVSVAPAAKPAATG